MLRTYQSIAVDNAARLIASGKRKIIFQLPTGGGKTKCFSSITKRYIDKSEKSVLILVHRKELLHQTRKTIYEDYGVSCQIIVAGMKSIPNNRVYVGMVESVFKRLNKISNIGLIIIDEAHLANFFKIHNHFKKEFIIGVTATPISANKNKPLKNYYDDIVSASDIPQLIDMGYLSQNITYAPKDSVERQNIKIKNGEFDEREMGIEFSKPRYIQSTVLSYEKLSKGKKTLIFNATVEHSKLVCSAFIAAGYKCKHIDGSVENNERLHIFNWFKSTDDAILCNVGIATTGTDIPTIECVLINKSTTSVSLFLQMCGRGGRVTETKSCFTIIDMGGNALVHGDWNLIRNWEDIFWNPPKASKGDGVAPVKLCPECDAIIPAQSQTCKYCGFAYPPREMELEELLNDFVVVTKGINVNDIMERHKEKKEYFPFFNIGTTLAYQAKQTVPKMTDENANFILDRYHELAKEWAHKCNKKYNQWHKDRAKEHLFTELQRHFKKWNYVSLQSNALTIPRHG